MGIITLISDWGRRDPYTAAVKGVIIKNAPDTRIVDITHDVEPFNILMASYILRQAYHSFPEGSVHIVAVNTDESDEMPHVAILHKGHYFIGTDNGVFSLLFDDEPDEMVSLDIIQDTGYFTFPARDRFAKAACQLIHNASLSELGKPHRSLKQLLNFKPSVEPDLIKGMVVYIDGYQNIITNISEKQFRSVARNRPFKLQLRSQAYYIKELHRSYSDVEESMIVALFGTSGLLEIAVNRGNAAGLLGVEVNDTVRLEFQK